MTPAPDLAVAILAGGLATRLRPLTEKVPKALLDIGGEPFIAHQFRLLRAGGVRRAVVCAGYLGERIQEAVGDGSRFGLQVAFSFDGDRLLGTGGAVRKALPRLTPAFFVLYGDSYLPCPYGAIASAFLAGGKPGLMTVYRNEGRFERSNVEFASGRILAYDKRNPTPRMKHVDYGLSLFQRAVLEERPADTPFDLTGVFEGLLARGQLDAYEVAERFYEIGSPQGLEETRQYILRRQALERKGDSA